MAGTPGVFQALGFVDGHHAHQRFVTLQAQHLLIGSLPLASQQLAQVPNQRQLAIKFSGSLLQQLSKMQQIGQYSLAIVTPHQPLRQLEVLQQLAQHRQHTLALPALAIVAELHDAALPGTLVEIELLQLAQRQPQRRAGQRCTQRSILIRLSAGTQPQQQVACLLGGEHRILVGR